MSKFTTFVKSLEVVEPVEFDPVWTDEAFNEEEDFVNSPAHYNKGEIECIKYLEDNLSQEAFKGYLEGNVKKYLHRWTYKGKPEEDLAKASWYLNKLREFVKE